MSDDLAERVEDVLAVDAAEFEAQAKADAEVLKRELREGTFDNHQSIVGLEYEFYAVSDGRWSASEDDVHALMRVPRRMLGLMGFEKELGLHNAEMTTSPQPLNPHGLRAQESEVRARLEAALDCAAAEGIRLVSDGMWTIPPAGETAGEYLTDSIRDDGVRLATNMSDSVRYHAMANGPTAPPSFTLEAPHVSLEADTVMPEALITSIQPHYQVPQAEDLPHFFNYALRVAGPLLALGVNSPFFPADLYDDDATPTEILDDGWDEHRIAVFESVLNSGDHEKVTFPEDLDTVEDAVERVVTDSTMVPMSVGRGDRFDDQFATLRRKHGTYWRWVRPVFDGASRSSANARIEFRPIAGQPTVRDSVAFQAAFAGLMERLPRQDHPVIDLDWSTANENFYTAMREGPHGDIAWVDIDGDEVSGAELYEDLLVHARDGLRVAGCTEQEANYYLEPLRQRVETGVTPADWKRERVREALDAGADFETALQQMQREYVEQQSETLLEGEFADWF
ncbi:MULTISPECIES: hypothetical protein [Haloferax]|uniref:UCP012666 family protein n=1 Tax=Haloferax marinum TaxID=2666143 RepID=A0A6A8G2C6_9EURY|nr:MULTISPECIES: hypothetical protein [Haloferax]KAB1196223.1 hypothetical protein Hfx1150_01320 [Haloferax sp. CBA1150]MRW95211.1 hypothetical protein [Haloferax marinum]